MQNLLISIHRKAWQTLGYLVRVWGWGQGVHPGSLFSNRLASGTSLHFPETGVAERA